MILRLTLCQRLHSLTVLHINLRVKIHEINIRNTTYYKQRQQRYNLLAWKLVNLLVMSFSQGHIFSMSWVRVVLLHPVIQKGRRRRVAVEPTICVWEEVGIVWRVKRSDLKRVEVERTPIRTIITNIYRSYTNKCRATWLTWLPSVYRCI